MRSRFYQYPITPILASLMPLAYLASANLSQISASDVARLLVVLSGASIIFTLLAFLIVRDWPKAALATSLVILLVLSYGQIYRGFESIHFILGRHRLLLPVYGVAIVGLVYLILRSKRDLLPAVGVANVILLVLFLYSAVPVGIQFAKDAQSTTHRKAQIKQMVASGQSNLKPDVYFIVLDMYAREDVINEKYGYDNSGFLKQLEQMGFSVIECSQSNYPQTMYSLVSTLNMEYLTDVSSVNKDTVLPTDIPINHEEMVNSKTRVMLEKRGYKTVGFETGFGFSEINDADVYYSLDNATGELNNFETLFLNTTVYLAYTDYKITHTTQEDVNWEEYDESAEYHYRVRTNAIRNLENIQTVAGPKFVVLHLPVPHGPFVFNPDGTFAGNAVPEVPGYVNQLKFINQKMISIFSKIIAESDIPPVIILESDHGIDPKNPDYRMKNLMAYFGPQDMMAKLYPTITPVNSFRVMFDSLFGENLPLLPDYSFYSPEVVEFNPVYSPSSCPKK
jgi:hypothetical protein